MTTPSSPLLLAGLDSHSLLPNAARSDRTLKGVGMGDVPSAGSAPGVGWLDYPLHPILDS